MTDRRTVVVVGAGIIGCSIARELAIRGTRCAVIDSRPVAGGATQASAGMLAPYVEAHGGGPMLDLCVRSLNAYDAWIAGLRDEGADIEYRRSGTLEIALSPDNAAALDRRHGEWLEPRAAAALVPQLAPSAGALWDARHGYVDARQLANGVAQSAARHGATFVTRRVEEIVRRANGFTVRLAAGAAAEPDALEADAVVLAAGAWTNGIQGVRTPPLRPVRGQLLRLEASLGPIQPILWGPACYIVPLQYGVRGLLIGATVEDAGFDERPTDAGTRHLFDAAQQLLPSLKRDAIKEIRVGLRPATPDELPVLGDDPSQPGLFHASGHYRNGILLAPITAMLIADLILNGRRDPCLDHFRSTRFD